MNKEEIFDIFYGKEKWDVWHKFQDIENNIEKYSWLYEYYDDIKKMLVDSNSHIRLRGFRIICKLAKWDKDNKITDDINILLSVLDDNKPTIIRQCLAVLNDLLFFKSELSDIVEEKLNNINLEKYKDSMRGLIQKDIDNIIKR